MEPARSSWYSSGSILFPRCGQLRGMPELGCAIVRKADHIGGRSREPVLHISTSSKQKPLFL